MQAGYWRDGGRIGYRWYRILQVVHVDEQGDELIKWVAVL